MLRLVRETNDFILDRWTITRTRSFDYSRKHRRAVQIVVNDLMRFLGRVR